MESLWIASLNVKRYACEVGWLNAGFLCAGHQVGCSVTCESAPRGASSLSTCVEHFAFIALVCPLGDVTERLSKTLC